MSFPRARARCCLSFAMKRNSTSTIRVSASRFLIDKCYAARDELDLADAERIERLKEKARNYVTGRQMGWFKRICKQLGEMEPYTCDRRLRLWHGAHIRIRP